MRLSAFIKVRASSAFSMMKGLDMCMVVENVMIASNMYKMAFLSKDIALKANPGQFVHIKVPGDNSLLLRRPISIHDVHPQDGMVEIVYQVVGKGTRILSGINSGQIIDVLGPLGNGFEIPRGIKNAFMVGGGCGIAPLKFLIRRLKEMGVVVTALLGFRNQETVYGLNEFEMLSDQLLVTTDDGSLGRKGLVTQVLEEKLLQQLPDIMFACGPVPMLKAVQRIAREYNVPCQISLEERMGCGIGGCLVCSCAVRTPNGDFEYRRVCKDGPIFWSEEVILDEATVER
ncbi:dihydroorotate dehydrogenase electron transfer subunit [Caldicoprobacter guelmensis]|uniref:dihydroorotate dehydrogenase electron transfer subunit n=1 Tax=Caldicoprobacter guelmensis TaxID=1170224 RepID=UPI00195692C7|nr:dihydroorotate dehydrogenase electron transfer subunit [Caldicoprobacter guelmensis]MBM7581988.1 dihydroorotate dehydrogenase electron transfer subunit [Caldicoprobacter guelmensis]